MAGLSSALAFSLDTDIASILARSSSNSFFSLSTKARKSLPLEAGFSARDFHSVFVSLGKEGRKLMRLNSLGDELFHWQGEG